MTARTTRWWVRTGDTALTVAAVLGVLCIVLVIAAAFFDVRVMLFSTGSMSPTIPAGSAAVVRSIPASDVAVGDVVTVERAGHLPITHRVTSVSSAPDLDVGARVLTMRGDANEADDPFPYAVERVRLVVFAVPGVAPLVAAMGSPWVIGTVTVAATAVVVAMFWPRRRRPRTVDEPAVEQPRKAVGVVGPGAAVFAAVFAVVAAVALTVAGATDSASAAGAERVIQGEVIRLVSIESAGMRGLVPGASGVWQVGISADAPSPGRISVRIAAAGDPALGLRYTVEVCPERWSDAGCPDPRVPIVDDPIPLDGEERALLSMHDREERWLRIRVDMPASAGDAVGTVDLTVRAVGLGDDVATADGSVLPDTGAPIPWVLAGSGMVLLAVGALVMAGGRPRAAAARTAPAPRQGERS